MHHLENFARQFLDLDEEDGPRRPQRALQGSLDAVKLKWVQCEESAVAEELVAEVRKMPPIAAPRVLSYPDIALIVTSIGLGLECVELLERSKIGVEHTFSEDRRVARALKMSFYKGAATIKATTIQSFKGWESTALVVHIAGSKSPTDRAAIYTSLSRLKRHVTGSYLTVVCSDSALEEFGRTWGTFERRPS